MATSRVPEGAKVDLHCHSAFSGDGRLDIKHLAEIAVHKGLDGLAITDHNDQRSRDALAGMRAHEKFRRLLLIPGIECSSTEGHILGIGVRETVKVRVPPAELIDGIRAAGGVPVVSHPYRRVNGLGEENVRAVAGKLNAIEVFNARDNPLRHNKSAAGLARELGLGGTGGSDAHQGEEVGNAYTLVPGGAETLDQVLDAIEKRRTWGVGVRTPPRVLLKQGMKNAWLWARRGFKPI